MLKLSRANIQPQQTDASRIVSSMMPQQYTATPIKTAIEALDLPEQVQADTIQTKGLRGYFSNTPPSLNNIMRGIPVHIEDDPNFENLDNATTWVDSHGKLRSDNKYLNTLMDIESYGGKLDASNPSGALGPYQFLKSTWLGLGLGYAPEDRANPEKATNAIKKFTNDNIRWLRTHKIPVNYGTVYLAHNQGRGGAKHVMDNFYVPLKANSTAEQWNRIKANIPADYNYDPETFTGQDFYNIYNNRFK